MATIREVIEIPLDKLVIGKGQVRLSDVGKEIDELAESISKIGLLEPIVVCPAENSGRFEILTGQRRFLAHKQLGKTSILAAVLTERVDDTTAKVISVTENLVRRNLNSRDLVTVCTALFKKYGSIKDVCEETGLPQSKVSLYVKYDRLRPEMKKLVDKGEVEMKVALKAQDIASVSGDYRPEEAVKLAKELTGMSGAMRKQVEEKIKESPSKSMDDVIEGAKSGEQLTQMIITLGDNMKSALNRFAADEGTRQDEAARSLIEEGLLGKGYMEESD